MLTLAVDCSLRWLNLGLASPDELYGEENVNAGTAQAELLPGAVGDFLAMRGFALSDVGRIAVTTGPGYYTGIRIGLSYATALAEGLRISVVPVSALCAMAHPFIGSGLWAAPVIRARKGCVYGAIYSPCVDGNREPDFYEAAGFAALINSLSVAREDIVIIGRDAEEFDDLKKTGCRRIPLPPAIGLALARASLSLPAFEPALVRAAYARGPE